MKPAWHILIPFSVITFCNFLLILSASVSIESDPQALTYIAEMPTLPRLGIFLFLQISIAFVFGYLLKEATVPYRMSIRYAFFFIIGISAAWITGFNILEILFPTSIRGVLAWIQLILSAAGSFTLTGYMAFTFVKELEGKYEEALTILIILFLAHGLILSALIV